MELREIETHARALMTTHGVGYLGFEFDNGKVRLGATHFRRVEGVWLPTKITLSRHYAAILPDDEIRDVILHEIAHALAGKNANHGPQFMAYCRAVGAKPARCARPSASPEARVTAVCPECGRDLAAQHRLPQRIYVCKVHRRKPLTWMKDGIRVAVSDMPVKYRQNHAYALRMGRIDA